MGAPQASLPPLDPTEVAAQQTAQNQLVSGLQTQSRSDTASLMASYGALAMANGALPGSPPSTAVARVA